MGTVGIICEYNPFHLGHGRQLALLRRENPEETLVCLMSGNYVQRGKPAIFDRTVRAKAAILGGADLVLELPVNVSLRSAEGFADGGIEILSSLGLESVCFGAETPGGRNAHGGSGNFADAGIFSGVEALPGAGPVLSGCPAAGGSDPGGTLAGAVPAQ